MGRYTIYWGGVTIHSINMRHYTSITNYNLEDNHSFIHSNAKTYIEDELI